MPPHLEFLQRLFRDGRVILRGQPVFSPRDRAEASRLLAATYADYRLQVAAPLIDFDAVTALAASELLHRACWFLVNHDDPPEVIEKQLSMPEFPVSPAQHLSADLVLRYLPLVHRRAQALAPADRLPALLAQVLRQWPLSGVLSDVADEPLISLELGGHPGLLLLYAERLARNDKPGWRPEGQGLEYVELVKNAHRP